MHKLSEEKIMKYCVRLNTINQVLKGVLTNKQAAQILNLSVRQIIRLKNQIKNNPSCLPIHKNSYRKPHNAYPECLRQKVIELFSSTYKNFNIFHFTDMLKLNHNICLSRETVRLWLKSAKILPENIRKFKRRKRRPPSPQEGQMVFLDGSPHKWFSNEKYTLLLAVDDATGKPLYGIFAENETLKDYFKLCYEVFTRYGIPQK